MRLLLTPTLIVQVISISDLFFLTQARGLKSTSQRRDDKGRRRRRGIINSEIQINDVVAKLMQEVVELRKEVKECKEKTAPFVVNTEAKTVKMPGWNLDLEMPGYDRVALVPNNEEADSKWSSELQSAASQAPGAVQRPPDRSATAPNPPAIDFGPDWDGTRPRTPTNEDALAAIRKQATMLPHASAKQVAMAASQAAMTAVTAAAVAVAAIDEDGQSAGRRPVGRRRPVQPGSPEDGSRSRGGGNLPGIPILDKPTRSPELQGPYRFATKDSKMCPWGYQPLSETLCSNGVEINGIRYNFKMKQLICNSFAPRGCWANKDGLYWSPCDSDRALTTNNGQGICISVEAQKEELRKLEGHRRRRLR